MMVVVVKLMKLFSFSIYYSGKLMNIVVKGYLGCRRWCVGGCGVVGIGVLCIRCLLIVDVICFF